jgi:hypothetical protein
MFATLQKLHYLMKIYDSLNNQFNKLALLWYGHFIYWHFSMR